MASTTDLLGLDFGEQPQVGQQPPVELDIEAREGVELQFDDETQPNTQPRVEGDTIAYPPAWTTQARNVAEEVPEFGGDMREFTVRCQGRWRVRNAPSLNSRVVGSISSGTLVFGHDAEMLGTQPNSTTRSESLNCLWVRVSRFEAKETGGVSEIRHDKASGGAMYCLRRNALGYGLYDTTVESLDGPLIFLPDELAIDLRDDAQRTNIEKNEDVSLTWKLLGAADSFSRFFSPGSGDEMRIPAKKRAEEIFEVKQRELLKKAANSLSVVTGKITSVMAVTASSHEDLTVQLPKEVRSRFARLRVALAEASANLPGTNESEPSASGTSEQVEGSYAELQTFSSHCVRLERAGGWPELSHEVRQEMIHFSQRHLPDLENHARNLAKGIKRPDTAIVGSNPTSPSMTCKQKSPVKAGDIDLLGGISIKSPTLSPSGYPSMGQPPSNGMSLLLPPPPPPANSVGGATLI